MSREEDLSWKEFHVCACYILEHPELQFVPSYERTSPLFYYIRSSPDTRARIPLRKKWMTILDGYLDTFKEKSWSLNASQTANIEA